MDMEKEHGYNSQPRKEKTTNFRKPNPQREEDAVEKIDKILPFLYVRGQISEMAYEIVTKVKENLQ